MDDNDDDDWCCTVQYMGYEILFLQSVNKNDYKNHSKRHFSEVMI